MKYRKKPDIVDAFQVVNPSPSPYERESSWPVWLLQAFREGTVYYNWNGELCINTTERLSIVKASDWIIKNEDGYIYPCHPAIFAQDYEVI